MSSKITKSWRIANFFERDFYIVALQAEDSIFTSAALGNALGLTEPPGFLACFPDKIPNFAAFQGMDKLMVQNIYCKSMFYGGVAEKRSPNAWVVLKIWRSFALHFILMPSG